jgi:hypothetical protein
MNMISKNSRSTSNVKVHRVPDVIVDFEYDSDSGGGFLFIIIQNIGLSPAYKISVKFDNEIIGITGVEKKLTDLSVFKCLEFLPPGKKIRIFVDTFLGYLIRKQPLILNTTIIYTSKDKQKFREAIKHDLSIYKEMIDVV